MAVIRGKKTMSLNIFSICIWINIAGVFDYIDRVTFSRFVFTVAPPVFVKIPPSIVEVLSGESLTLSCSALGNPKPTVTWRKEDSTVEEEDKIQVVNKEEKIGSHCLLMC